MKSLLCFDPSRRLRALRDLQLETVSDFGHQSCSKGPGFRQVMQTDSSSYVGSSSWFLVAVPRGCDVVGPSMMANIDLRLSACHMDIAWQLQETMLPTSVTASNKRLPLESLQSQRRHGTKICTARRPSPRASFLLFFCGAIA